jgi:hypothetical protein
MLIPVNQRKDLGMNPDRFLVLFSNYDKGDRHRGLVPARSGGTCGGTMLSVSPVTDVEAQQVGTVESVDLRQRPSDYQANGNVMREIIQKTLNKSNKELHMVTPQPDLVSKPQKKSREISQRVKRGKSQVASVSSIVDDYNRLKTKKSKAAFITSLGLIYSKDPSGSKYILDGIEAIKKL